MTNVDWQVIDIKPTFTDTSNNSPFQAILLTPKRPAADGRLPPLVTMIHGGPHSNINTSFDAFMFTYLVACGFAVVLPNYRGSTVCCPHVACRRCLCAHQYVRQRRACVCVCVCVCCAC